MPSSMIHLLAAHKYKPKGSPEFWIGNLAPDSVSTREIKDAVHLRISSNRQEALEALAKSLDLEDDLMIGILLHLYLDMKWDAGPMKWFIQTYEGEHWFQPYRDEIGVASAWLYHHSGWCEKVWETLSTYDYERYPDVDGFIAAEIEDFVQRNYRWHKRTEPKSCGGFSETIIEELTDQVAKEFGQWIDCIGQSKVGEVKHG